MQFKTKTPHGLVPNDLILIKGYANTIDGIYKITESPDSTDSQYRFSVAFDKSFDSTQQNGSVFKLQTIRINDIDDIDTVRPPQDFVNGDKIYVDNNYLDGSGKWKIFNLDDNSYFTKSRTYNNATSSTNNLHFASSIDIADTEGKTMLAGSPGCLLYTSPSPRDLSTSRMPSSA